MEHVEITSLPITRLNAHSEAYITAELDRRIAEQMLDRVERRLTDLLLGHDNARAEQSNAPDLCMRCGASWQCEHRPSEAWAAGMRPV